MISSKNNLVLFVIENKVWIFQEQQLMGFDILYNSKWF